MTTKINWLYLFRSQYRSYRRFRFGILESLLWAKRRADEISKSGREFAAWERQTK
jgi:hypothetical protein